MASASLDRLPSLSSSSDPGESFHNNWPTFAPSLTSLIFPRPPGPLAASPLGRMLFEPNLFLRNGTVLPANMFPKDLPKLHVQHFISPTFFPFLLTTWPLQMCGPDSMVILVKSRQVSFPFCFLFFQPRRIFVDAPPPIVAVTWYR